MKLFLIAAAFCAVACGSQIRMRAPRLDGRIIGGRDTDISEVPYQLSLLKNGAYSCGASVISENWVLTSGICVYRSTAKISFRAGSSKHGLGGSVHSAKRIITHPRFNPSTVDYDYALVEVEEPFQMNKNVQTVKLADNEPQNGTKCIASGWGMASDGLFPNQLQSVELSIVDRTTCGQAYPGYDITRQKLHNTDDDEIPALSLGLICAGSKDKDHKGFCEGDFGAPLVSDGQQVGMVSWQFGCGNRNYPGIYSNVAESRDWIKQISGV